MKDYLNDLETVIALLDCGYNDLDSQERAMVNDRINNVKRGLKILELILSVKTIYVKQIKNEYRLYCHLGYKVITKKQFDLLKEELKNE